MTLAYRRRLNFGRSSEPVGSEELEQRVEHEQGFTGVLTPFGVGADDVVGRERDAHRPGSVTARSLLGALGRDAVGGVGAEHSVEAPAAQLVAVARQSYDRRAGPLLDRVQQCRQPVAPSEPGPGLVRAPPGRFFLEQDRHPVGPAPAETVQHLVGGVLSSDYRQYIGHAGQSSALF
jgi:hypothetical protein